MSKKIYLTWKDVYDKGQFLYSGKVYGVPKGGMIVASFLFGTSNIVWNPEEADIIFDDIVDSGKTRDYYKEKFPDKEFISLYEKPEDGSWLVFPWEVDHPGEHVDTVEQNLERLRQYFGDDDAVINFCIKGIEQRINGSKE